RTGETDDGLSGKEGTFLICSFWLVSALAIVGELQMARDLMERLLRIGSPLGLYAEEFDASTGRHLGNFPQAFSHLALIEAAARGEDPTEPPASAPYPFPAVSHEPRIQQLSDDLAAAGFHPFHAPCGIRLAEDDMPHSACVRCQNCDGFPCAVHGKSDAEVLGVRPALEHPNVTLLTNAKAVKLETDPAGGAVTEVVVERNGDAERVSAHIVVLACGAANTAKLLLRSA